jgi:hypothetical protein
MRFLVALVMLLLSPPAAAYIGPGTGAGVIATVLGIIGAVLIGLLGVLYYPIKRFIKALKARRIGQGGPPP